MHNLINIKNKNGKKLVSAKELYLGLGLNKTNWSRWYPTNLINNGYFKENEDWVGVRRNDEGAETMDFAISIDFAKHIAMMARTEKSHEYRNYFLEVENNFKESNDQLLENANNSMADISPLLNEANCTPNQKLIVFKGILRKAGIELPLEGLEPLNSQTAYHIIKFKSHVSDFVLEKCEIQE
ncbi:MAG TPA: antA/AntB antirepressor family protein [Clostridium sp.]